MTTIQRLFLFAQGVTAVGAAQQLPQQASIRNDVVEVTVSRQAAAGASEAEFSVTVSAPASAGLAPVIAALGPVGVRAEHLRSVNFQRGFALPVLGTTEPATANYTFSVRTEAARLEAVSTAMDRLFRKPPSPLRSFSFSAQAIASSGQLETMRLNALPGLFAEARAKAEAAWTAAGQSPGPVLLLQDQVTSSSGSTATVRLSMRMARQSPSAAGTASLGRSVAAVATRAIVAPFDVASISLRTNSTSSVTLERLGALGVTAAEITSQSSTLYAGQGFGNSPLSSTINFALTRPAGELVRFLEIFTKLDAESPGVFGFSVSLEHSPALVAREREKALPQLLEDARRRAEPLARLLNLPLGNPRTISDGGTLPTVGAIFATVRLDIVSGSFLFGPSPAFFSPTPAELQVAVEYAVD